MRGYSIWVALISISIAIGVVGGAVVGPATSTYDISASGEVNTEPRTVSLEGTTYEVSAVSSVDQDDTLVVDVTAPTDEEFDIDLYNSDRQVEASRSGAGDDQVRFDLSDVGELSPGSYVLGLYVDGNYQAIYPVVIEGYEVETDHPTTITEGDSLGVDITVTETERDKPPETVELIRHTDDDSERVTASHESSNTYRATLDSGSLEPGDNHLYAITFGPEVDGNPEPLALSPSSIVTVKSEADNGGAPPTETQTSTPTETPVPNETESPTDTPPTPTASPVTPSTDSPTVTQSPTSTETPSPSSPTDDGVITPTTDDNGNDDDESASSVDGGDSGLALLTLLSLSLLITYLRFHRSS